MVGRQRVNAARIVQFTRKDTTDVIKTTDSLKCPEAEN
jgi:hypothetical protein